MLSDRERDFNINAARLQRKLLLEVGEPVPDDIEDAASQKLSHESIGRTHLTEYTGPHAGLIERIISSATVWPPNPAGSTETQIPISYQVPGETVQEIIDILQGDGPKPV